MLADFHFLRPWWLLALLLVPFIGWLWRHRRHQAGNWQSVIDAHLLPHLVDHDAGRPSQAHAWLAATLVVLSSFALAGPAWEKQSLPLSRNEAARILAIELAPTMLAADVKPTRLERARYKVSDILVASRDMQTALIGYSGDAFVAAPLTDDINTVRNLIDALSPAIMPVVGNNAERAIAEALKLVAQAGLEQGELILLADSAGDRAVDAARAARAQGLRISVLGVGSAKGAPVPLPQGGFLQDADGNIVLPRLDEARLRALAQAGGGRYATLSADRSDLDIILDFPGKSATASKEGNAVSSERYLDRGVWLVVLMLPLALLAFRRGWLMLLPLALFAPVPQAQAMEWIDLWQRPDQQAAKALAEGDVERAQHVATDPLWRGSAEYRAGEFASAAHAFASASGAQAMYNQGNALARAARYEEAIDAYRRALDIDPALEDAEANKKAVEDWLKRQQSQQQENQQNGDEGAQEDSNSARDNSASDQNSERGQRESKGSESAQSGSNGDKEQQQGADRSESESASNTKHSSTDAGEDRQTESADPTELSESGQGRDAGEVQDAAEAAADAQSRADQQSRMTQAIDKALESAPQGEQPAPSAATGESEAAQEQQQAHKQWLQRVPDDPGGLLRRKFQLEYERRQHDGDGS